MSQTSHEIKHHSCSSLSPSQFLSFASEGLEGHLGFAEVLVPVVLHVQVDLASSRPLPQLQGDLPVGGEEKGLRTWSNTTDWVRKNRLRDLTPF